MRRTETIRGQKRSWQTMGRGESVLFFLHGFPDRPDTFQHQFEALGGSARIIAPELLGSASAGRAPFHRYSLESGTLDYIEILRLEGVTGPVHLVAHDIGVPQAWHLAQHLGDRVGGIVMMGGVPLEIYSQRLFDWDQLLRSWYIGAFQVPGLSEWFLESFGEMLGKSVGERRSQLRHFTGMIPYYRQYARSLSFDRVPLQVPVLALWGNQDPFVNAPNDIELSKVCKKFEIRVLEGGHWIHQEQFQRVNHHIQNFLGMTDPIPERAVS